jgi:hypothetical protein
MVILTLSGGEGEGSTKTAISLTIALDIPNQLVFYVYMDSSLWLGMTILQNYGLETQIIQICV